MKIIVYETYGQPDVLQLKDVAKPVPKDNEVLIKVRAVGLNFADWISLTGSPFFVRFLIGGLSKPKNTILGADIAGIVEAVGKNVTTWQPDDEVFGDLSSSGWGGLAEYVCAPANLLVRKPANISFAQAAAVPMAAVTALHGLRDAGHIQPGQKVLINGASGGVGTFAVQIAKALGGEVTAVCSTGKIEMVQSIGADHVIDYTIENFTENGRRYDLILAANGYHPISHYKRVLTPEGTYICAGGEMKQIFQAMLLGPVMSIGSNKKIGSVTSFPNQEDLAFISELLAAGKIVPVIDKCYPLNEATAAFRYLGQGHAKGKVIIIVEETP